MPNKKIPDGWKYIRLNEVSEKGKYGTHSLPEKFGEKKARFVNITEISKDGYLTKTSEKYITIKVSAYPPLLFYDKIFRNSLPKFLP